MGVALFPEVDTLQSGTTYLAEELERMELPIETRFTLLMYNSMTKVWSEVCGSSVDDVQFQNESDGEEVERVNLKDDSSEGEYELMDDGSRDKYEWNRMRETAASLALLVALESTEVTVLTKKADILWTKARADRARETEAYIQWTKAAKLAETMVSLAVKAKADESAKAVTDGAKMVAAETQEQMAAEPRARAAEDRAQPAVAPPKPMDSDGRGNGQEPPFRGGNVASEQLISGGRLDLSIPNYNVVGGGSADPSVAYFFF
jgi:hypothetical protein